MRWTATASAFSAALVSVILVAGLAAAFGGAILGDNVLGRTTTATQTTTSILTTTSTQTSTSVQTETKTLPPLTTTATTTIPVTTTISSTSRSTTTSISTSFATVNRTTTQTITDTSTVTVTASATTSTVDLSSTLPAQIVESCSGSGSHQKSATCTLKDSQFAKPGSMLIVEVSAVGPVAISDSNGNSFSQLCDVSLPGSNDGLLLYSSIGNFTSPDTISVTGGGNFPNLVVHEISGLTAVAGVSVGSGDSNTPSVSAYSPAPNSFVIGALLTTYPAGQPLVSVSAGQGYTLIGQYGGVADEYHWPANGATDSPFSMNSVDSWAEASVGLSR